MTESAPAPVAASPASRAARARLAWAARFTRDGFTSSLFWAALAGGLGALATLLFRACIAGLVWIETGRDLGLVEAARSLSWPARIAVPTVGGLVAGTVLWISRRRGGRDAGGDYMEAIVIGDGHVPFAKSLWRSVSSLFTIASGGSIGREGPMVQLAAATAALAARMGHLSAPRRRMLVACGAAAGLTSAYNAPIASALFVAEIVLGSIAVESLAPLLVAAMVANLTTHAISPDVPLYPIADLPHVRTIEYVSYALLGLVAGLGSPLFLGLLDTSRRLVDRIAWPLPVKLMLGGLAVGLISVRVPEVWGNGYSTINGILAGLWLGNALLLMVACKLAATASTVGSGAIGGVFTPTLFVGAALGALLTQGLAAVVPGIAPPLPAGAAVAMAAFLAGTTQAPLTAILMVLEMTGAWALVLPLMLACVTAYLVVRVTGTRSIYAAAEQRRRRDAEIHDLTSRTVAALVRPSPPTLAPDAGVDAMAAAFATWRFQYLYVVDEAGLYRGAVSLHDLRQVIESAPDDPRRARTASALVTPALAVLDDTMTLQEALEAFRLHRGERLPVVDGAGRLVGAAWKTDLLLELQQRLSLDRS